MQAQSSSYPGASPGNPAISLNPSVGTGGSSIAVSGSGFVPNGTITVTVDGHSLPTDCTANASGSFNSCAFPVPAETGGTHTVIASDSVADSAAATYTAAAFAGYTNPAPPASSTSSGQATNTGNNPVIRLNSGAGKVGSNIAVSGSGFEPYQDIALAFDGSPLDAECTAHADGSFRYCVVTIPSAAAGTHTVTASDDNANAAAASYTVNPGIKLTPSAGPAGSSAAVSGSGFAPDAPITLSLDGDRVSTSCKADANGSFSYCGFTVPDVHAGVHTVTASDSKTNSAVLSFYHSAAASYTVTPALSLNLPAGAVGSTVMLSGSNYKAGSGLTVTFDGAPLRTSGTCAADKGGTLPTTNDCTFTVPAEAAGSYNVTVSDGTYTGSATYTVKPDVGLTSKAGAVGSTVAASGSGFASFSPITLAFGDRRVATSCAAGAAGRFSYCAFTVPAATAGTHTVTALDDQGNSDAASYKVLPSMELTSSSGPVGGSGVLNGSGFKAKDTLTLTFDSQSLSMDCTTNANGSLIPCAFTVPAASEGTHKVTVSDGTNSAWTTYTVDPAINLNPIAGAVGSIITLSGSNYTPNSSIGVTFDGTALKTSGTCIADASGNLFATNNCAFTVPAVTAGSYNVTVSDGSYSGSATYTVNAAISLTPNDGPVGSGAMVSGSGFVPYSTITVAFDGSSVPTSCTAGATGSFSYCAFTVPAASTGYHTVGASDGDATYALLIDPYSGSASKTDYAWAGYAVTPAFSLNPIADAVGSTITLSGSNYKAGSHLTVTFDGAPLSTSGTCTADKSGNLPATNNCAFTVPAAAAGTHTVTVSDGAYSGTVTFAVDPALSLSASAGAGGSSAAVSGSGFAPNSPISLAFDGSGVSTSCTTDATGSFSTCMFTVPAVAGGSHTVTASDGTNSGTATFAADAAFSLTPSAGPAGSRPMVSGSGFAPHAPITVAFDGSKVATSCTANASGRLSNCAFTVPAATAGAHTVTASDGRYSGTATYTVDPAISLTPGTGAAGSSVTVIGSGFAPGTVAVTFDGSSVSSSCKTDSTGKLSSCVFTVPATTAGSHAVAATDQSGNFASAVYTV